MGGVIVSARRTPILVVGFAALLAVNALLFSGGTAQWLDRIFEMAKGFILKERPA
jgi:hypothetical protein